MRGSVPQPLPARGIKGRHAPSAEKAAWTERKELAMPTQDTSTPRLTTSAGTPVADDQNSLTAGDRGPLLMQDWQLIEKLAHQNRGRRGFMPACGALFGGVRDCRYRRVRRDFASAWRRCGDLVAPWIEEGSPMKDFDQCATPAMGRKTLDIQSASEFQAALLGMAGHDLRQPLQVIQSAYEWLGARVDDASEKARLARGERAIATLTEQLDRLVGALRLYEHAKSMEISSVSVPALLWRISEENEDAALERGVELRVCPSSAAVMSNAVLLDGILRNLVRNAIRYTDPGGRILIGCRRSGSEVRIDVYDTGVGMAPEHLPRIFEAFQRLDSTRGDGLGIGLFVVRRAIQLLGHRIEVKSALSRGSRFSVFARAVL